MSLKAAQTGEAQVYCDCSVEPSRTKQSFAEEADLNLLMERYTPQQVMDLAAVEGREAVFGDFSDGVDFMEASNRLLEAQAAFGELSARVRERFRNDPALLVEFVSKDENREEAVRLGLVVDRRAVEARSERSRSEDVRRREIAAAEARGRAEGVGSKEPK